jgi:hypothetical protein
LKSIQNLEAKFADDIARLNRMTSNMITINEVEFAYHRLVNLGGPFTREFMLENEVLTTGLVVSYGRLFARSTGATQIEAKKIPIELRNAHDELMDLRNRRYAHHGAHPSIVSTTSLTEDDEGVVLDQHLSIGMWIGAPRHWGPLIVWLRVHIVEKVQGELAYLSKKSGVQWRMTEGPRPEWATE